MVRLTKILLAASAGILILLVGVDNILDYNTNYEVVKHILTMDAVSGPLTARAIAEPRAHEAVYLFIIVTELVAALVTLYGALRLWRVRELSGGTFQREKSYAVGGLALALWLYVFGFMAIGGEWFEMWRAGVWNMQEPAFRFIGCIGLVLLFVNQRDD